MGLPEWYTNDAVAQYLVQWVIFRFLSVWTEYLAVADPGKGPGEATPLIFKPIWGLKLAEKIFLQTGPSPLISGSWLLDPPLSQDLDLAVVWSIENCLFYFLIPDNVYVFIWIQIRTSIIYWCKYQPNNFFQYCTVSSSSQDHDHHVMSSSSSSSSSSIYPYLHRHHRHDHCDQFYRYWSVISLKQLQLCRHAR